MNKHPPPLNLLPDNPQSEAFKTLLTELIQYINTGKSLYFQGGEYCSGQLSQLRERLMAVCIDMSDDGKSSNS